MKDWAECGSFLGVCGFRCYFQPGFVCTQIDEGKLIEGSRITLF